MSSHVGQRPDTINGQYLSAVDELTSKGAKIFPHYQYVLDQIELEQNCFPMQKYADVQRAAKEESQKRQEEKREQNKAKEGVAVQNITENEAGDISTSNYYSAIGGDDGNLTLESINEQEEEKKRQQELASRSTPYNLQRSSAIKYENFQALGVAAGPPLPYRRMLALDCEMVTLCTHVFLLLFH